MIQEIVTDILFITLNENMTQMWLMGRCFTTQLELNHNICIVMIRYSIDDMIWAIFCYKNRPMFDSKIWKDKNTTILYFAQLLPVVVSV